MKQIIPDEVKRFVLCVLGGMVLGAFTSVKLFSIMGYWSLAIVIVVSGLWALFVVRWIVPVK